MKIAILGTRGIPNNYGGFEQFAQILSQGLVQKGCEVYVYNSHNHIYKEKKWQGVNIIHKFDPEYLIGLSGQFIYDLNCIINSRKHNFDVILQLGYTTSSIWGMFLPRKTLNICNPDGMEWKRSKYPKPIKSFLKFAEKLAVKYNKHLIADSLAIQKYYQDKYSVDVSYVAYSANIFEKPDLTSLNQFNFKPYNYNLLIARFQPDNNIETIIKGILKSKTERPLMLIGNYKNNKYGKYLREKYQSDKIIFQGAIYDIEILNNLRYYSHLYFHGHSAGGTNPSLLEAMATSALIIANNNPYNKAILKNNGFYFANETEIAEHINKISKKNKFSELIENNLSEIKEHFNEQKIIDKYYKIAVGC